MFVSREDGPDVTSSDDTRLRDLRIGVELVGDDGANSPPVHALGHRGIVGKLTGYPVYGDYSAANPPARIIEAVAAGDIDVAIAWGRSPDTLPNGSRLSCGSSRSCRMSTCR